MVCGIGPGSFLVYDKCSNDTRCQINVTLRKAVADMCGGTSVTAVPTSAPSSPSLSPTQTPTKTRPKPRTFAPGDPATKTISICRDRDTLDSAAFYTDPDSNTTLNCGEANGRCTANGTWQEAACKEESSTIEFFESRTLCCSAHTGATTSAPTALPPPGPQANGPTFGFHVIIGAGMSVVRCSTLSAAFGQWPLALER